VVGVVVVVVVAVRCRLATRSLLEYDGAKEEIIKNQQKRILSASSGIGQWKVTGQAM